MGGRAGSLSLTSSPVRRYGAGTPSLGVHGQGGHTQERTTGWEERVDVLKF